MNDLKRSKKSRTKNTLFNPYKNGISTYDIAYLSSKRVFVNKTNFMKKDSRKEYYAA